MKNAASQPTLFAVITVVTCGVVISVQSSAIAGTLTSAFGEQACPARVASPSPPAHGRGLIFVFSAMVIFGGIRTVARVTEWMAPSLATVYVIMVAIVCLMNITQFGTVLGQILALFRGRHRRWPQATASSPR